MIFAIDFCFNSEDQRTNYQCRINQTRGPVPQLIAGPFSDSRRTFQRNHLAKTFSLSITKNTMKHDHKHNGLD